jgi:hypothetical protein
MPRRTVTVSHIYESVRLEPDNRVDLDQLPTGDLLYTARALFEKLPKSALVDAEHERYVAVEKMTPAGRSLLIELSAGPLGEAGEVRDSSTHEVQHEYDKQAARTVSLRAMLVVPKRSRSACRRLFPYSGKRRPQSEYGKLTDHRYAQGSRPDLVVG